MPIGKYSVLETNNKKKPLLQVVAQSIQAAECDASERWLKSQCHTEAARNRMS